MAASKRKIDAWLAKDGLRRIELWAQVGYSDTEMSHLMDISRKTFYQWLVKYPEIGNSITRGREHAADTIEDELFKRARGQTITLTKDVKIRRIEYDPDTGRKLREYEEMAPAEEEIYVPADVRAQTYFLGNRRPEDWGEKRTVELGEKAAEALRQPDMTLSERQSLLAEMQSMIDHGSEGE